MPDKSGVRSRQVARISRGADAHDPGDSSQAIRRAFTDPPPAIAFAWPTPIFSSKSNATSPRPATKPNSAAAKCFGTAWANRPRSLRKPAPSIVVITNAVIVDHWGIVKADIGIRGGRIVAIGKAGNPDIMNGVTPGMVVGAGTEAIAGEGKIVTAGGIDAHVHFICPQLVWTALSAGLTTLIGGGTVLPPAPTPPHARPGLGIFTA